MQKGRSLTSHMSHHPKVLILIAVVFIIVAWPRAQQSACSSGKAPVRYGLMMDGGSTGSRIHVFEFKVLSGGSLELAREVFEEVKPGLSQFADPKQAAASLVPLLDRAMKEVPAEYHACSLLALRATAGLRLLGLEKSSKVLAEVEALFHRYPFQIGPNAATVMDGSEEGPGAWLTVNFLLNSVGASAKAATAAIIDMGGASTQIVFLPDQSDTITNAPSENIVTVRVQGRQYKLYQHSYLGYGLNEARKSILHNPEAVSCLFDGATSPGSTLVGKGSASFDACLPYAEAILQKSAACKKDPCSFNGVYQPKLSATFSGPIFAFSYYYDRMHPFLDSDGSSTVGKLKEVGKKLCEAKEDEFKQHAKGGMCVDMVYLYALLKHGYDLPDTQPLQIKKKIKGIETSWALGAMIAMME